MSESDQTCSRCGGRLDEPAEFCPHCGEAVGSRTPIGLTGDESFGSSAKGSKIALLLVALSAISIGMYGSYAYAILYLWYEPLILLAALVLLGLMAIHSLIAYKLASISEGQHRIAGAASVGTEEVTPAESFTARPRRIAAVLGAALLWTLAWCSAFYGTCSTTAIPVLPLDWSTLVPYLLIAVIGWVIGLFLVGSAGRSQRP